ncbi:uncharacterized protein LOC131805550 [Musca domestica]|uniref:Uncharacterized protein LOC131805550 n=1 Tax=Musca domestica TaxID=7370 RepID=A0ABM3VG84_MUSDO|nr:uncharacterized protein LOC131805550 [Musca domestica]
MDILRQNVNTTWDTAFLMGYILPLVAYIKIPEVIWFISERLNGEHHENLENFMLTLHARTFVPQKVLTNTLSDRIMQTDSKRNYLGVVLTTSADDPILDVHNLVLKGRHGYLNFVVIVDRIDDFRIAEETLYVLERNNFELSLLYVGYRNGSSDLYGITSFPEIHIAKRTNLFSTFSSSMSKVSSGGWDAYGYKYKTPLRQDVPYVFSSHDGQGNVVQRGISFSILNVFLEYVNASMEVYEMPKDPLGGDVIDMRAALNLIRNGEVIILSHAYALFSTDDNLDISYPIMVVRWCIMVPQWNRESTFYYALKPFTNAIWYAVLGTFVILCIIDGLWIYVQSLGKRTVVKRNVLIWLIRDSVLENFCFIINIAASRTIKNPSIMRFLFYAAVWFHGFFLTANYTSLLGSILTVTIFRGQINTMEDLIRANISVMIIDYEYDFLMSGGLNLSQDFLRLIRQVDSATFAQHQLRLNKSYAYFVTDDVWNFLAMQQGHLKQGLFKLTDICFGSFYLGFPMEPDTPVKRSMEYFIRNMYSSGLLEYFENNAFDHALQAGLVQHFNTDKEYTSAHMEHVMIVFVVLFVVYIVSVLTFFMECGYAWLKGKRGK